MPILFKCELCRARLSISRRKAGKMGVCPKCGEPIRIPLVSEARDLTTKREQAKSLIEPGGVREAGSEAGYSFADDSLEFATAIDSETGDQAELAAGADVHSDAADPDSLTAIDSTWETDSASASAARSSENSADGLLAISKGKVLLPRWVVYFQASLLAVAAGTFFVFGMMVGSLTSSSKPGNIEVGVSGRVLAVSEGQQIADEGAVILLLPANEKPDPRPDGSLLSPADFRPLNNSAIDIIRNMGGQVGRANRRGEFELLAEGPREFYLLIISKNTSASRETVVKRIAAQMGRYFLPYQDVIGDRDFQWREIKLTSKQDLGDIKF